MDLQNWSESNNQYLAASLRWLRLRLERLGAQSPQSLAPVASAQETRAAAPAANGVAPKQPILNRWFGGAQAARNEVAVIAAPLLKAADLDEQIALAASEREEAAKS